MSLGAILKSYATGPDGVSYAPGRLMAFVAFAVAQAFLVGLGVHGLVAKPAFSIADWREYFGALVSVDGALAPICVGLILGAAPSDPGGKWWGREASAPPPPGRGP